LLVKCEKVGSFQRAEIAKHLAQTTQLSSKAKKLPKKKKNKINNKIAQQLKDAGK